MSAMTLADYQADVILACRNIPATDAYANSTRLTRTINEARALIIRENLGDGAKLLFPELRSSWTVGPTYPGQVGRPANEMPRSSDIIAIQGITSARQATQPDWSAVKGFPLSKEQSTAAFDQLAKSGTNVQGYPTIYCLRGLAVLIYPTPNASFPDWLHYHGIRAEALLSAPGDSFLTNELWDRATVLRAAAMIMQLRGWYARAQELFGQAQSEIDRNTSPTALESMGTNATVKAEGSPERYDG